MPLQFRQSKTATGRRELIAEGSCSWVEFPKRAQVVVEHFGMAVIKKTDSHDVRMWIAGIGEAQFCISWDVWMDEVSVMAWEDTPDSEIERLVPELKWDE